MAALSLHHVAHIHVLQPRGSRDRLAEGGLPWSRNKSGNGSGVGNPPPPPLAMLPVPGVPVMRTFGRLRAMGNWRVY
eukprot:scaffold529_cov308-Pinguiococcus_pyrenoidosus.AAC.5